MENIKFKIPEEAIITAINPDYTEKAKYGTNIGLLLETDKDDIKILINNEQYCCENFGTLFFNTPGDPEKHIGAKLLEVKQITVSNESYLGKYGLDDGGDEIQLRIITSKGYLQYAIYNAHNGYYAHSGLIQIFNNKEEITL